MNPEAKEPIEEMNPTAQAVKHVQDNSETILFVRNAKSRKEKRLVEKEYNKTFSMYKDLEGQFAKELFKEKKGLEQLTDREYKEIFREYNGKWKKLCDHNYINKRHIYTIPNKFYFENKYKPIEQEAKVGFFARIRRGIQNRAQKLNFDN